MKRVIALLIVVALLGAGVYYFLTKDRETMPTCEPGFRLDFSTRTCVPVASEAEDKEVDFGAAEVKVPETNIRTKLQREGETSKYTATFEDPNDPSLKGFMSVDASQAMPVGDDLSVVPLFVTFGGTGQFLYISLFDTKTNEHKGSVFVGDRIDVGSIDVKDSVAKANYKTRLESEGYAAEPTIPAQLVIDVSGGTIREIMRLQNADYSDVEIKSPIANGGVSGEFVVRGSIPGTWFFEANAGFRIMKDTYEELAIGSFQALSDWMTTQRVPFEFKVDASKLGYMGKAKIVIVSDNVQGDDEGLRKQKKLEIPVVLR